MLGPIIINFVPSLEPIFHLGIFQIRKKIVKIILFYFAVQCKDTYPIFIGISKRFQNRNDFLFGTLDFANPANDPKKMKLNVNGVPGIKLFLKDSNQEINYWGKDDEEEIINFLEKHTRIKKELK